MAAKERACAQMKSRLFAFTRSAIYLFFLAFGMLCPGAVPTPKDHLGFTPGDDFKLADYHDIISYFQKLTRSSDRILLTEFGRTAGGKPMYIAYISAPEN